MSRLHLHRLRTLLCGLLPALLLAGCGEEPTPPRLIGFTPPVLAVPANETLEISVTYEDHDARLEDFQWRVEAGEIEGNGAPTVTYRAPAQPGDYAIAVTAAYGDDGAALTLDGVVQVTQAIATGPPAVVAAAEAEPGPAAGSERAEAPEQAATAGEEGVPAQGARPPARREQAAQRRRARPTRRSTARDRRWSRSRPPRPMGKRRRPSRRRGRRRASAPSRSSGPSARAGPDGGRQESRHSRRGRCGRRRLPPRPDPGATAPDRARPDRLRAVLVLRRGWPPHRVRDRLPARVRAALARRPERRDLPAGADRCAHPDPAKGAGGPDRGGADQDAGARRAGRLQPDLFPGRPAAAGAGGLRGRGRVRSPGQEDRGIEGATSLDNIRAAAADCGFELGDDLVTFRRHADALQALLDGEVDAFTSDGVALRNFAEGQPLKVVGEPFSKEPYAFAVPKGDERLRQLIDQTLRDMEQDGTYAAIYERWFGDEVSPYPLGEAAAPVGGAARPGGGRPPTRRPARRRTRSSRGRAPARRSRRTSCSPATR